MTDAEREALIEEILELEGSLGVHNDKGHLVACFSHKLGRNTLKDCAQHHRMRTLVHVKSTPGQALFKKIAN